MTRIKICGIKDSRHVIAASQLGVDFLGMVFAPSPGWCHRKKLWS